MSISFSMLRRARVHLPFIFGVSTLAIPALLLVGYGQSLPSGQTVTVDRGVASLTTSANARPSVRFGATVNQAPTANAECRLSNGTERGISWSTPEWTWEYRLQNANGTPAANGTVTGVPPIPSDPSPGVTPTPTPDPNSPTGYAYLQFSGTGSFTLTATATVKYKATCNEGETAVTPSVVAFGTSEEVTITVGPAATPTPTPTPIGGDNIGGENIGGENVGGENIGGENIGGENVGGENVGGENVGGENVGGENVGGENVGGENIGGENVGGENVGGENVGGENVGGENVGGENIGGENVGGENVGGENVGGENVGGDNDDPPSMIWKVGDSLSGTLTPTSATTIGGGESVSFSFTASDSDHWEQGNNQGDESDTDSISFDWKCEGSSGGNAGTFSGGTSSIVDGVAQGSKTWTAPTQAGNYTIIFLASDDDTGRYDDRNAVDRCTVTVKNDKIWTVGGGITSSFTTTPPTTVEAGEHVTLSASGSDSDHWKQGTDEGDEADVVHLSWDCDAGSFVSSNDEGAVWQAPTQPGTYTVTVVGNDDGSSRCDDESDSTPATATIVVTAPRPRNWVDGAAIDAGEIDGASDGDYFVPGSNVSLEVLNAQDTDHWTRAVSTEHPLGESGDEEDDLTYQWSATIAGTSTAAGSFVGDVTTDSSCVWKAPTTSGDYVLAVVIDDVATKATGDTGDRDDAPAIVSINIHVAPKIWTVGDAVQVTRSSPDELAEVLLGDELTFDSNGVDNDHWVQGTKAGDEEDDLNYHWSVDGIPVTTDTENPYSFIWNTATGTVALGNHTVTCTVDDNGTSRFDDTEAQVSVSWTVTVKSAASEMVSIRRVQSGNSSGDLATIAAGGVNTDEHKAEVEITLNDDKGSPKANAPVDVSKIQLSGHKGAVLQTAGSGTETDPAFSDTGRDNTEGESSVPDAKITFSGPDLTTDSEGKIRGILSSSNKLGDVTVTYDGGRGDDNASAVARQVWSNNSEWLVPNTSALSSIPVTFKARFLGEEDSNTAISTAIKNHQMAFRIVAVEVEEIEEGVTHDRIFCIDEFRMEEAGVFSISNVDKEELATFATLTEILQGEEQASIGNYLSRINVHQPQDGVSVVGVWLQGVDKGVWK